MKDLLWVLAALVLVPMPASSDGAGEAAYTLHLMREGARAPTLSWDVLIVPPGHGQTVLRPEDPLPGFDPADPGAWSDGHTAAAVAGIKAWVPAVASLGPEWLKALELRVHVLRAGDDVQTLYEESEAVVIVGGFVGHLLGQRHTTAEPVTGRCTIRVSAFGNAISVGLQMPDEKAVPVSFSTYDIYNIVGHEFGHCYGLEHVRTTEPLHELMNQGYWDEFGARDGHLHCVSNLDILGLVAATQHIIGLPPGPESVSMPAADYATVEC